MILFRLGRSFFRKNHKNAIICSSQMQNVCKPINYYTTSNALMKFLGMLFDIENTFCFDKEKFPKSLEKNKK